VLGFFLAAIAVFLLLALGVQAKAQREPADAAETNESAKVFMPVALTTRSTRWSRGSIFGVQMYNDSRAGSKFHESLLQSGATWMRTDILWSLTEPSNTSSANYDWNYADQVFGSGLGRAPMRIIGTIRTAPSWAVTDPTKPDGPINPAHMSEFLEFVGALVERFDGDGHQDAPGSPVVEYWEFYNEPDRKLNASNGRWGNHGKYYADMLSKAYPVVKARNPNAKVVLGGLAYDFFENEGGPFVRSFLDDVLAAGGASYFDIFNFHAYASYAHNWLPDGGQAGGPGLLQKSEYLRAKLNSLGIYKPMIITEAGWHSDDHPNYAATEEIQARYVVQLYTQSLAADIDVMIWWMLYDPSDWGMDNGLITDDSPPRRKPSFLAHQTIVNLMTYKEFTRTLSEQETNNRSMEAYEFRNPTTGKPLYISWLNPVTSTGSSTLSIVAEEVRTIDIYGTSTGVILDNDDGADDGRVVVSTTSQPKYIEVVR